MHVCAFENDKPAVGAIHELPVAPCPVDIGCFGINRTGDS